MKGSTNMKKIKRAIHFDFHTLPGIDDFCANFDAEKFASQLADAHVDYVNMFARCNIGFSYYPTKMGTPYPTMKGNMFGDVLRECHKKGILVTAYLNGGLNHELLVKNPGFMKIFKDGNVYKGNLAKNNFFREPCFNTPYRQYLLDEIKEILEMDPDGIFCDCIMTTSCYCPACIKKMNEQGIDTSNDEAVFAFALDTIREVFAEIRAIVPKDKRLYLNSHPYEDVAKHQSHAEVECLPTGGWGYDFLPAAAPYFRKFSDDLLYMTGRFVRSWGDFGGVKTITAIENDVYDGLLYGYAPSIGDHLHPRDGLIDSLYKEIGKIYAYVMELEKWTDNTKPKTEVAILRNKITHKNVRKHTQDSDKGAARMLSELKISYDAINEDMDLDDVETAANLVQEAAHPEANIIFGASFDENLEDEIRVTVIATGFDDSGVAAAAPAAAPAANPFTPVRPVAAPAARPQGLFTGAAEKAAAAAAPVMPVVPMAPAAPAAPAAEASAPAAEEDPFDSIFKIFNTK